METIKTNNKTMKEELTFFGKQEVKDNLLSQIKEFMDIKGFIRGVWIGKEIQGTNLKCGCFHGGITQTNINTLRVSSETFGIPLWYNHITEKIYEKLPEDQWFDFPYQAIELLPVGIDANAILSALSYWLLDDQLRFCKGNKEVTRVVKQCRDLFTMPFNQAATEAAIEVANTEAA